MQKERPNARPGSGNRYLDHSQQREQQRRSGESLLVHLFLSLVLPPVGLLFAWHSKRLSVLGRMASSLCALAVLTGAFVLLGDNSSTKGMLPTPQTPALPGYGNAAQTAEPALDPYGAGAPIDEGYQITYGDGTTESTYTQDGELPIDPLSQVTIVYAVTNNAQYYHSQQVCEMQNNSRALILQDAIAEGLQPCSKCYPDGAPDVSQPDNVVIPDDASTAAPEGEDAAG